MGSGVATTILVTAVVAIAVAQIVFCVLAVVLGVRILREVTTLRVAATETLDHVNELAVEATGGIQQARAAATRVGAVLGSGRSLIENAIGATVLRRLAGRRGGDTGGLGTIKTVVEAVATIWRTIASLRRQPSEAAPAEEATPSRSGLGTGAVREISRRSAPLHGAAPPPPSA